MENFNKEQQLAIKYQQHFYELLPDWFLYNDSDYAYIKQQIGFALLGPNIDKDRKDDEIFTRVKYDNKTCKVISTIYQQILDYGKQINNDGTSFIYLGIIYNIIFNHTSVLKSKNGTNATTNEVYALPIFKIKRDINKIWYIDIGARVYKSWEDYLNNNTLPKCIMVVPKNGKYQCNIYYKVTKYSSVVWVDQLQSPACCTSNIALKGADITINTLSIASAVGLGAATIFTPIGPVLGTAGLICCGVSGIWNIARSTRNLIDLSTHKESIKPTNLNALSAWITISTSALNVGSNSGKLIISRAISNGSRINEAAKIAYNSVMLSNLTANGIGLVFQGFYLIDQYKNKKEVDLIDIVLFSSHILFFSNAIINTKLAGELIRSSNGTIFEKFKNLLRFDRFREEYNRVNNVKNSNSNEILHRLKRITNKTDFSNIFDGGNLNKHFQLNFENGKIQINGITLLDPILLIQQLLTTGVVPLISDTPSLLNKKTESVLKDLLLQLLTNYYSEQEYVTDENSYRSNHFHNILTEIKSMEVNNAKSILKMIFGMGVRLIQFQQNPVQFLEEAILFMWEYAKANLKQNCLNTCSILKGNSVLYNILTNIVVNVFELFDQLSYDLYSAFHSLILNKMNSY